MLRRTLALTVLAAALVALAPATALAARITVRVEGKAMSIFGKAPYSLEAETPLDALQTASRLGEFHTQVTETSFGPYVIQIGRHPGTANSGWVFKVNGASPPVGADQVRLRDGDSVLWYWADFDQTSFAGPTTLLLQKTSRRCYASFVEDDNGVRTAAANVRIWIAGVPRRSSATGRFCLAPHVGLVHVTRDGSVRSNALR